MTDTTRSLIQQLAGLAKRKHYTCEDSWYSCPRSEDGSANDNAGTECNCGADEHNAKVDAICAALAQPETEELTDEELLRCYGLAKRDHCYEGPMDDWPKRAERAATVCGLRAVIAADRARWGRPAVEPVPVSKRLPGEGDCDPSFQCWWFTPSEEKWILWPIKWAGPECSHWLPHHALPIPTTTTETP